MHEQGGEHQEHGTPEIEHEPLAPRVYVASLSDYNDGRLHGEWIDATLPDEELYERVQLMLARSPMPDAEEWAIHDFDDFGGIRLGEYELLETVAAIGRGIKEHGLAFAAYLSLFGTTEVPDERRFEDAYLGQFESMVDFARHVADDLGFEERLD